MGNCCGLCPEKDKKEKGHKLGTTPKTTQNERPNNEQKTTESKTQNTAQNESQNPTQNEDINRQKAVTVITVRI